jgi:hypothetical protein
MADDNFEDGVLVRQLLTKAQRLGVISSAEVDLVRKFHCEGYHPEELQESAGPSAVAPYRRIQRTVNRLRRIAGGRATRPSPFIENSPSKILSQHAIEFSRNTGIRNSEGDFSPELSQVPQPEHDFPQIGA